MLRLNLAIPPTTTGASNLGLIGNDPAGFPTAVASSTTSPPSSCGRVAGATLPLVDKTFTPDGAASQITDGLTAERQRHHRDGHRELPARTSRISGRRTAASWSGWPEPMAHEHAVEARHGPSGPATVMADIGGDVGAAVVYTPSRALAGHEIEIRPAGARLGRHAHRRSANVTSATP